jgi:hypothetical protein
MAYAKHQLRCIELGLCIACGIRPVKTFRRCRICRERRSAAERQGRQPKPDALCHPVTIRERKRARDRAEGRGYWPEIHGRLTDE